ncbi:hypothetical protein BJ170DRAFT_718996 [Xylariales sp. AK1849]|nr:hypothetical protein BJ170DRAFT_718996 [Xylariales sp. AK1849]
MYHIIIRRAALAMMLLVVPLGTAEAADGMDAVVSSNSSIKGRSEDCDLAAKWMPFAGVNCYYDWVNTNGDNFLNYVVQVSGTGQRQDGWCSGITANIVGDCGIASAKVEQKNCGTGNSDTYAIGYDADEGTNIDLYGIDLNVWTQSWQAGEDNRVCIMTAIRKATCDTVSLDEFECYKR